MCSVDCGPYGMCVDAVCVCPPPYTSVSEGISEQGCILNEDILQILWAVALAVNLICCVLCIGKLLHGFCRGRGTLHRGKVYKDAVFQVIAASCALNGGLAIYCGVRLFTHLYFLHSYLATFFFIIPWSGTVWIYLGVVGRLFRQMLRDLVHASGIQGFKDYRPWWASYAINSIGFLITLPCFAGPSVTSAQRLSLLRYWLICIFICAFLQNFSNLFAAERAILVLKKVDTPITLSAEKKLRGLTVWTYAFAVPFLAALLLLACTEVLNAPYFIAVCSFVLGVSPLPRVAVLSLDLAQYRTKPTGEKKPPADRTPSRPSKHEGTETQKSKSDKLAEKSREKSTDKRAEISEAERTEKDEDDGHVIVVEIVGN